VAVSITTPASNPSRRVIVSTGTVQGFNHTTTRSIRATADLGAIPPVFYMALASKQSFGINGNVTVNSAPTLHQGNTHSNGNITLSGSAALVDGAATASGTVSTSGSPVVTGGTASGVAPMTFPDVDATLKDQALASGTTTGNALVSDGSLVKGKISGNLTVSGSGCQITGVVWVTGNLTIKGPITGKGTLICDGTMSLDCKFSYPVTALANIVYICTSTSTTAADLGGNRQFKGVIYVPNGGVKAHGTPNFFGGILAKSITFSGNPSITRWTQFDTDPPPLPKLFQLCGWEEI
jgi:hypothetical protein